VPKCLARRGVVDVELAIKHQRLVGHLDQRLAALAKRHHHRGQRRAIQRRIDAVAADEGAEVAGDVVRVGGLEVMLVQPQQLSGLTAAAARLTCSTSNWVTSSSSENTS